MSWSLYVEVTKGKETRLRNLKLKKQDGNLNRIETVTLKNLERTKKNEKAAPRNFPQ